MKHHVIMYACIATSMFFFTNTHEQLVLATQSDFLAPSYIDNNRRCTQCSAKNDPMENTAQLVIAQIPVVFDSFMKIVQDPNNKETVPHHISTIVSSIVNIAASAFKGRDRFLFEEQLRIQIEHALIEYIAAATT